MATVRLKQMGAQMGAQMGVLSLLAIATLAASPTSALAGQQQNGQQGTANAIARGNHARAVSNVHQSIYQIYLGSPRNQANDGYWADPQSQSSNQQATANSVAAGDNSTAVSNIDQSNYQNQFDYQNGYGNPYWNNGYGNNGYGNSSYENNGYENNGYGYWNGGYGW